MACSFQKEETVLIDMLMAIESGVRVFTIDTGALFPETYEIWREVEQRYGLKIEVEDAVGPWSADNCCGQAKVAGLERGLEGAEAWITGVRREQSPTRADAEFVERDEKRGMWKYNPLADWTERDVWRYIREHVEDLIADPGLAVEGEHQGGEDGEDGDEGEKRRLHTTWMPHSSLSVPAQRPSRPSPGWVQGTQPIEA